MGLAALGAAAGPFIGVTLSLVAVIHKERITWRAVSGAVLAVGGVAMLFLHP
jgi:drug/metabolite transporter (DMT)-like permease